MEVYRARLEKYLEQKNAFTDALNQVEGKTGIKKIHIVAAGAAIIVLWLILGYGASFLASFIGFVYPAYCSVKAIESSGKDDDTKWLTYWVVYASFSLLEFFADIFLWWIPLYAFLKCCFLVYCMLPIKKNGSVVIYNKIIRPLVLRHQKEIEQAMTRAVGMAEEIVDEVMSLQQKDRRREVISMEEKALDVDDNIAESSYEEIMNSQQKDRRREVISMEEKALDVDDNIAESSYEEIMNSQLNERHSEGISMEVKALDVDDNIAESSSEEIMNSQLNERHSEVISMEKKALDVDDNIAESSYEETKKTAGDAAAEYATNAISERISSTTEEMPDSNSAKLD